MNFSKVTAFNSPLSHKIYDSYTSSFPEDERRSEKLFKKLFTIPEANVLLIEYEEENVGYLILWKLTGYVYVEHFEIFEEFRNKKLGSKVLQTLLEQYPKVTLETEPDGVNEFATRRIKFFYERNGFKVWDKSHEQPSYEPGKRKLNLYLLASREPSYINAIKLELYTKVYACSI